MKYNDVIKEARTLYPSEYTINDYKLWIDELDGQVADYERREYEKSSVSDEVCVPVPYQYMYVEYLMAKIAYHQHDDNAYQKYISIFNAYFRQWQDYVVRTNEGEKKQFQNWL